MYGMYTKGTRYGMLGIKITCIWYILKKFNADVAYVVKYVLGKDVERGLTPCGGTK